MEQEIYFTKYNKLNLYKNGLKKFIDLQLNQSKWIKIKTNLINLGNLDYVIGILFLTEMNRHCKNNNFSIHGYYITCALINFFYNIKNKLFYNKKIPTESVIYLFNSIANNINYLNSRVDETNPIKKKINENFINLILELTPILNEIIYYKKNHEPNTQTSNNINNIIINLSNSPDIDNGIFYDGMCNKNCYKCWVDEILTKFNYILLILAKFMGTGCIKEPNLYKLAEYYSNILYVMLKLDNNIENKNEQMQIYQDLFANYQDYKTKLIYSNMELEINSDTIDEIIKFLDDEIMKKFIK